MSVNKCADQLATGDTWIEDGHRVRFLSAAPHPLAARIVRVQIEDEEGARRTISFYRGNVLAVTQEAAPGPSGSASIEQEQRP